MSISRYRVGELVEVRSAEEILATLDSRGMIDGTPFMPEMLRFCGQQFAVSRVAHKTCDTFHYSGIRRQPRAVLLGDARCDGAAHGGCQAACLLVWKDEWLKPVRKGDAPAAPRAKAPSAADKSMTRERLQELTSRVDPEKGTTIYTCQVTELLRSTSAWAWWNPSQYWADFRTGNFPLRHVVRTLVLAALRTCAIKYPNHSIFRRMHAAILRWAKRPEHILRSDLRGPAGKGQTTPQSPDSLREGDWVRIKPVAEILPTLNHLGANRGLSFDTEMVPYCGGKYRVRGVVRRIIDEPTGVMREMKNPCIALEGVVCNSEYSEGRYMCPRGILSYWRPIWLEKLEASDQKPHGR